MQLPQPRNRVLPTETYRVRKPLQRMRYRGPVAGYKEQENNHNSKSVLRRRDRERETQIYRYRDEVLQQFGLVIVYKRLLRGSGCLVL